jgi:hypothetical protein
MRLFTAAEGLCANPGTHQISAAFLRIGSGNLIRCLPDLQANGIQLLLPISRHGSTLVGFRRPLALLIFFGITHWIGTFVFIRFAVITTSAASA